MLPIVLASSSIYRRALLERLELPFTWAAPEVDESALPGESAQDLTLRLAQAKAQALAGRYPAHLIIGSDQALLLDGVAVSKPGNHQAARRQLQASSGKTLTFHTSLCLLNSRTGASQCLVEPFEVVFRTLDADRIERYLLKEQPYDCAGSFKMEGLGITLFHALRGDDPNSLIGLPLIRLCDMLIKEGIELP